MTTRRDFLSTTGAAAILATLPITAQAAAPVTRVQRLAREYFAAYEAREECREAMNVLQRQSPLYGEYDAYLNQTRAILDGGGYGKWQTVRDRLDALERDNEGLRERYHASLPTEYHDAEEREGEAIEARFDAFDTVMAAEPENLADLGIMAALVEIENGEEENLDGPTMGLSAFLRNARQMLPLPEGFFTNTRFA